MEKDERFRGVGVAIVTPFKDDESIDEAALARLVDWHVDQGTDFLVPCGTTGENPALSHDEHLRVIEIVVKRANGRVPVLAGAGSNSTTKAVDFAIASLDRGADGILTITPYYNKPTPDGLLRHFSAQAEALEKVKTGFPMILYNVPGRTGTNMTAATTLRIAREIPNVIGVKEASANLDQIMTILRERDPGFLVVSGEDSWTLPMIALGADGVISVAANEIPGLMKQMVSAALSGDFRKARDVHERILPLMEGNFIESNPGPVKTAMKMMNLIENDLLRAPLAPMSDANRTRLREILAQCELLPASRGA
ncbi:MAG: 4-hydroxy-tetrahydrodipicolinate synthase [Thermoanaerobaculia bacterium]